MVNLKVLSAVFGAILLAVTTAGTAWAQSVSSAQVSGVVRDSSGGVLPGVTITITQTNTGFVRSVVTESGGTFVAPNLPLGPYKLEAALQGFRTFTQTGIVLQVNSNPTINVTLALGDLAETISVEGAAPLVDVRSAGISEVVDNQKIVELPLQGRQVTNLIILAGAAVNTGDVFYDTTNMVEVLEQYGVLALEMETSALYTLAARFGRRALTICTVSDMVTTHEQTPAAERETGFRNMVEIALEAALNG